MIDTLLADADIVAAALRVHPGDEVADCIARAAWSVIAEPGDTVAGALIEALGAADALSLAVGDPVSTIPPGAGSASASRALADARVRWRPRAHTRAVHDALRAAHTIGAQLVIPGDESWPVALDDLGPGIPTALWVRGRSTCFAVSHVCPSSGHAPPVDMASTSQPNSRVISLRREQ